MKPSQSDFDHLLRDDPALWPTFCSTVAEVIAAGFEEYSSDGILHLMRWRLRKKLNNIWTPFFARKWLAGPGHHRPNFFKTRESVADVRVDTRQQVLF